MKCPTCGIQIGSLPCLRCEREAIDHEWEFKSLIKEFNLVRGAPETDASRASLDFALDCIHKRLAKEQFSMTVSYDTQDLLCSGGWWYVPYRWIGCRGFIVNRDDGYVNWLGSALSLRDCFWGHEAGVVCDLVDFTFSSDTDVKLASRLLTRFKHMRPNASGRLPSDPVWYRESETLAAVSNHFPTFKRHFIWFAIPDLFQAWQKEGLRFTCSLSTESNESVQTTATAPRS